VVETSFYFSGLFDLAAENYKHICAHLGECYVNLRYAWLNVLAFAEQPVKHVN